ncbi:MAG: terminase family protein [Christensenellaceae bacterium]|nr:terminase family protein [Christensenellaceae bacterium]MDD6926546.1 terminase family protein [bacterium]MDY2851544.1 terminase family protein [Christensenellaceae bacterium]
MIKRFYTVTPMLLPDGGSAEADVINRIIEIEKEQKRRKDAALATYNAGEKVHKKQLAFHKSKSRNRWVFGGNRSGKTECGAVECLYMALGIHPYRENRKDVFGWVVSLSSQVQRDVAQKKILHYLDKSRIVDITMLAGRKEYPENGIIDQIRVRNAFGGVSVIGFKSCDQGREKFQGSSLDFVWFDEEPPRDIYEECRMRVLDKSGDIFGTMTPLKGLTFAYTDLYLKADGDKIWCEFMEWKDNPYLPESEIEALTSALSSDELESRRYGRFHSAEGLVYTEFTEECIIEPFDVPFEWQDTLSIDPGLNNPLSCHWYCTDYDGNVYVVAEHYAAGKTVDWHAERIREISSSLGWHTDGKGRIRALIDSAANQKTLASPRSVSDLFFEQGILVDTKVNKDLFAGISRVKQAFSAKKLFIFKNCVNLIRELKGYWWGNDDVPLKKDDHALDELRYYIMSKRQFAPPLPAPTEIQKDKERLARKIERERRAAFNL